MVITSIGKEKLAEIIVANLDKNPRYELYAEMLGDEPQYCFHLEVVDFCDCKTIIGNYYGGGCPFMCDFGIPCSDGEYCQEDIEAFEISFYSWLNEGGFDENEIYIETNTGNINELPVVCRSALSL